MIFREIRLPTHLRLEIISKAALNIKHNPYELLIETRHFFYSAQQFYPNFNDWFGSVFYPGLNNGHRFILRYLTGSVPVAVSLLKKDEYEKKVCSMYVVEKWRRQSIARTMLEKSMEVLESEKPVISIPGERMPLFRPLIRYFGFIEEEVKDNYYRPDATEYVFNGHI